MMNPDTPTFMRPSMKETRLDCRDPETVSCFVPVAATERCDALPDSLTERSEGTAVELRETCKRG